MAAVESASKGGAPTHSHDDRKIAGPQRPPLRSNFDLEPNPFEQSFSSSRNGPSDASSSSVTTQASLKQNATSPPSKATGETPKPMLPPLASIASPSDNSYAWGMSATDMGSLRSGPLSPAMLAGPQHQSGVAAASALSLGFDASTFGRTGLTPSTGLTPLVGGPVSFPPPSPNTAAFLAMVSNSTTAATLASTTAATITPNTLSAITGVLNNTAIPQSYQPFAPRGGESYSAATGSTPDGQQVNGLFLLSQAHQELAKREEAQRASSVSLTNDSPVIGNNTAAAAAPRRAPKRKTTEPPTSAAPASTRNAKKPRAAAAKPKRGKRGESSTPDIDDMMMMDDDDDDDMMMSMSSPTNSKNPKKPETEEEKRRNFLERNRQGRFWFRRLDRLVSQFPRSRAQVSATQKGLVGPIAGQG